MRSIIVTGASGFIGRNFIRHLGKDCRIVACIRDEKAKLLFDAMPHVTTIVCPMDSYAELPKKIAKDSYDTFYHFAWAGARGKQRADYQMQARNAQYTCDAAQASKEIGCKRFITAGTISENVAKDILENHYTGENLIYGLSKMYAHKMLDIVASKNNISYAWAKLSNIYGSDDQTGNLVAYTIKEITEGRVPTYGPCQQPYNFTHIEDVLTALEKLGAAETLTRKEYFISNGECRKLADYLEEVAEVWGGTVAIGKRPDDGIRYQEEWFSDTGLEKLGFTPHYSFSNGIRALKHEYEMKSGEPINEAGEHNDIQ